MRKFTLLFILLVLPNMSSAFTRSVQGFSEFVVDALSGAIMPLLFSLALALFIWGVAEFIRNSDNKDARQKGREKMLWGIIALFVMVTFIGLTSVLTNTVFNENPLLPQLFTK
jgi:membrane protease YdiL (CAAX protease family)